MGQTTVTRGRWGLLFALVVFAPGASAYEADQLTSREVPLADALVPANTEMDRLLDVAVERTNRATGCRADPVRTHAVLARIVEHETARPRRAPERGFWRSFGLGAYGRWLERSPDVERIDFSDHDDIFGDVTFWQAPILHLAGSSSTVQIAGVRIGTDKLDHFLALGFSYWKRSRQGTDWVRAVEHGTRTEKNVYGLATSNAFSFADLRANWDGFRFYATLLEPGSVLARGDDGCVARVRGFDWSKYVDDQYDEVHTPSTYTKVVQARLEDTLRRRAPETCAALEGWAPDGWEAFRERHAIDGGEPWIGRTAPLPGDPFDLDDLCASQPSEEPVPDRETRRR